MKLRDWLATNNPGAAVRLSERIGVPIPTIYKWSSYQTLPSRRKANELFVATNLGVPPWVWDAEQCAQVESMQRAQVAQ